MRDEEATGIGQLPAESASEDTGLQPGAGPEPPPAPSAESVAVPSGTEPQEQRPGVEPVARPKGVPSSRAGRLWVAVAGGVVVLIIILVFIFENLQHVRVTFFGAQGSMPLALALLFAMVLGALIVLCIGSIRIVQLRHTVRRRSRRPTPVE